MYVNHECILLYSHFKNIYDDRWVYACNIENFMQIENKIST